MFDPEVLGFTPDELALNRQGQMSARQRQTLWYHQVGYLVRGVAMMILNLILISYLMPRLEQAMHKALLGVIVVLVMIIAGYLIIGFYRTWSPVVHTVTGPLTIGGSEQSPRLHIGSLSLRISRRAWRRLEGTYPGPFRVYYSPAGDLLSLEPWNEP